MNSRTRLMGIDFTSAPRKAKPITVAHGRLDGDAVMLESLMLVHDWHHFEALLDEAGPWLAALDFPFSLPRAGVEAMGWPATSWAALISHLRTLSKTQFRAALDADRESRPAGARYPHRAIDIPARSHSPMKLVNPPVGLMCFEGAPRLLAAGLSIPGVHAGDPSRVAVEAYPGLLARAVTSRSYKSDTRARQTHERRIERERILTALIDGTALPGLRLTVTDNDAQQLMADGTGDLLDASLALMQAGWCLARADRNYGCPDDTDPLEGWIATL